MVNLFLNQESEDDEINNFTFANAVYQFCEASSEVDLAAVIAMLNIQMGQPSKY